MLDLSKLAKQIPEISQEMKREAAASLQRLEIAQRLLRQAEKRQEELLEIQKTWSDRLIFSPATPVESINTQIKIDFAPDIHTVFATDGSQLAPSHHEIAYCYLINIGKIMLHYGQNLHPFLDSLPEVYYKSEDLYASRQWGIRTEEWIGYRRTVAEIQILADMAYCWVNPPGAHVNIPNLAFVDGSLIYWFLDSLPVEARDLILQPIFAAWEKLRETKIPLMGYISAPRSIEALNFLRLQACPYSLPNCTINCSGFSQKTPCQVSDPLRDATLWSHLLEPGYRGALWKSSLKILDLYDQPYQIYFCYVNVGTEIARLEFPAYVVEDTELFDRSLSIMLGQVQKGYGYPISLSEAHNIAVVKGGDRTRFFALLQQHMIRNGIYNVKTSYKETRKRGSIA